MNPDFWGEGYASEAVGGLVDAWSNLHRMAPDPEITTDAVGEKLFAALTRRMWGV